MKRKIIALALAALTATGLGTALAANDKPADCCADSATCLRTGKDSPRHHKHGRSECGPGREGAACLNPFEGLNLSADQSAKIKAIYKECREKCSAGKDKSREVRPAGCRAEARREMLAKVKEVLTPAQYVTFLENNFVNTPGQGRLPKGKARHCGEARR